MRRLRSALAASLLALAPGALAVVPVPPDQVAVSAIASAAGPYDVTARVYDAASGGALLYKQSFSAVPEQAQHHFTVNLGPTGAATDSPANPLTTNLRAALSGDLAAGTNRFVELTVNADPPLARVQLVLVPYAMRADRASTADVAAQALDTQAVSGLDGAAVNQLWAHYNEDGGPPASDPREGTADTDGDGEMNFVDADNDNDGLSDTNEIGNGKDINLVTPSIGSITPSSGTDAQPTPVTVAGNGFLPGLTVVFGDQTFHPTVTTTSFQVTLAPRPVGTILDLLLTNANGETATKLIAFTYVTPPPPAPVPFSFNLTDSKPAVIFARGEELLVAGGPNSNAYRFSIDTTSDGITQFGVTGTVGGLVPAAASWNAAKVVHGLRGFAATDAIELLRDANADNLLAASEATPIESPGPDPVPLSPSLVFDGSNRPGGAYIRSVSGTLTAMAFHDRNADGVFTGPNELVTIETVAGATNSRGEAAFDLAGHLAYAYVDAGVPRVRIAWDRSGDGDFNDLVGGTAELVTVPGLTGASCLGLAFDKAGRLALVTGSNLFRDLNGDGDVADAGENQSVFACDVTAASAGNRVVLANGGRVLTDLNDDGDWADANEDVNLGNPGNQPIAITETASGAVRILTPNGVLIGPVR